MEWWLRLIVAYCAVTYILGVFICLLYFIGGIIAKVKLRYAAEFLFYALLSPIFTPWWIAEFVRSNKK